jgi:hypothetical protein
MFYNGQGWPCGSWGSTIKHTNILRKGQLESQYYLDTDGTTIRYVSKLTAEQKNNYANWFTYYRTRGHVQIGAMLAAIEAASSNDRLGLISGATTLVDVKPMTDSNRDALVQALVTHRPSFSNTSDGMATALSTADTHVKANGGKILFEDLNSATSDEASQAAATCRQNHLLMFTTYKKDHSSGFATAVGTLAANDMMMSVENKVYLRPGISDNEGQHIKTSIIQMADHPSAFSSGLSSYSYPPASLSRPFSDTYNVALAPFEGKGSYRWLDVPADNLTDSRSLVSLFTTGTEMVPKLSSCMDVNYTLFVLSDPSGVSITTDYTNSDGDPVSTTATTAVTALDPPYTIENLGNQTLTLTAPETHSDSGCTTGDMEFSQWTVLSGSIDGAGTFVADTPSTAVVSAPDPSTPWIIELVMNGDFQATATYICPPDPGASPDPGGWIRGQRTSWREVIAE